MKIQRLNISIQFFFRYLTPEIFKTKIRMKIKTLIYSLILLTSSLFVSCDDTVGLLGENIQPETDTITMVVDSVYLTARTISLEDSVYAKTIYGLLGKYQDNIFGTVKSDYLCQFYSPSNQVFNNGEYAISIDSARMYVVVSSYSGDTLAPMGLSVYEIDNPPLDEYYYTNMNPSKYCSMTKPLGRSSFTMTSTLVSSSSSTTSRAIEVELGQSFGQRFYDKYISDRETFQDQSKFNEFFPGAYVTTDFGTGLLMNIESTQMYIYYSYVVPDGNYDNTADSTYVDYFTLSSTSEVFQMNHVQNSIPDNLLTEGTGAVYLKSPAGVCAEITIPMQDIINKLKNSDGSIDENRIINLASFTLEGYTELEDLNNSAVPKASSVMLIDKDSIGTFFLNKSKPDDKFATYVSRSTNNTFSFTNIAEMIKNYVNAYNENGYTKDLVLLVLPVDIYTNTNSSSSTGISTVTAVYNKMSPTSSVLRTSKENLKMKYSYSKY